MRSQPKPADAAFKYRAELDSLRALAIIPVVIFHLWPGRLPGGYLGVDVFFVLSGYLISTLLLRDLSSGSLRLGRFYARRIRRLAPVILTVVTATLLVATICLTDAQRVYVAKQSVAALVSVSNFFVWRNTGDYWGPAGESTALLHTWSLSVEEQFYLLYPPILALIHRWKRAFVTPFLLVIIVVSCLLYWIVMAISPSAAFYLLPTRSWELACGGVLASLQRDRAERSMSEPGQRRHYIRSVVEPYVAGIMRSGTGCATGLALIAIAYYIHSDTRSNEWNTMLVVAGTMLVLSTPQETSSLRYLSWRPAAYIGRVSYSWYMWHWPIIVLNDLTGLYASRWTTGAAGFVAAVVSYHLVEQTTRRRTGITGWIVVAFCVVTAFAAISMYPRPIEPADPSLYLQQRWYGNYYNAYADDETGSWYQRITKDVIVPKRQASGDEFEKEGIRFGEGDTPEVVLLGDSHATMWAHLVHRLINERGRPLSVWALNGRDPLLTWDDQTIDNDSIKSRYDAARKERLAQWEPELAIVSMRWSHRDPTRVRAFVEFVAECSDQVLLIGATPELRIGDENARYHLIRKGIVPSDGGVYLMPPVESEAVAEASDLVQELADSIPNVHALTLSQRYLRDGRVVVLLGRRCLYLDDDHLTDFGTWLATPDFRSVFERLLPTNK